MRRNSTKPIVYIICGHVGSGKTTTAKMLAKLVDAPMISVDSTLKRILTNPSFVKKDGPPSKKELALCYNIFSLMADYLLSVGSSVIIDGAFAKIHQRRQIIQIAEKYKAPYKVFYVVCPKELLKKRVVKRFKSGKGVGWNAHLKIKRGFEELEKPYIQIDTSKNVPQQLYKLI